MKIFSKFLFLTFALTALALLGTIGGWVNITAEEKGDPPVRQTEIIVSFTQYQWWLTRWTDNQAPCGIFIEHEGIPSPLEVLAACGEDLYGEWIATPPCPSALENGADTSTCDGLYLFLADIHPGERTLVIDLPIPAVWLTLSGCTPTPPKNQCSQIPSLVFTAEEPLPNEVITAIHVRIGEDTYDCEGSVCEIPMKVTSLAGVEIEFWADSSYGDESEYFAARARVADGGVSNVPGEKIWFVDILSSQWRGTSEVSSCGATWEAFPPLGGPPKWLSTPEDPSELSSTTPFVFLAGQLITQDLVDASECLQDGLLLNGAANACGAERARAVVTDWQNQFDAAILEAARETSIPAQLLKNLFAQESQFWPGELIEDEFGLGQLTSLGADGPLLWNLSFFDQFCPLVLHAGACEGGYAQLDDEYRAMLQGALATLTNANCPDCEQGIDLVHAEHTVGLFAQTLLGNCEQVAYIVYDVTGETPGVVSAYEDLWRFTLVNYNAGPGCLITALQAAWQPGSTLDWAGVSSNVSEACQNAITYVERVTANRASSNSDFVPTLTPTPKPRTIPGGDDPDPSPTPPYPAPTTSGIKPAASPTPASATYP